MRTKNCLSRFRDALTFSALLLALPTASPAQEADRLQLSPVLTKNHGYVREFLWKNWRDLRLAIEDCWKLNASPPPSISFTITSLFLRRLSSQKEPADRILADL
jgi:hypothetical protein